MSEAGTFTIQELGRVGGRTGDRPDGGEGERFEWTADRSPADPTKGGARAIPLQPWAIGGELNTVRTNYPGTKTPSEQVLTAIQTDQSFAGRWDDRYNFAGYAVAEMARFEAMCRRGNLVRIAFQSQAFECLITSWDMPYLRDSLIRYAFSCSVHDRAEESSLADRSPPTTRGAIQAFTDVSDLAQAGALRLNEALREQNLEAKLDYEAVDAVKGLWAEALEERESLGDALDQNLLKTSLTSKTISGYRQLATKFRAIRSKGLGVVTTLTEVRSDVQLKVRSALSVLAFEDWSRSMRFQGRVLMGEAGEAAKEMDERDEPNAKRLYRPHQGESLYSISRRFYGTADSWQLIANRNGLTDFELTGDELLIIPERGRGGG